MDARTHLSTGTHDADELQVRIANFKRTRRTAAPSMHAWCDLLIRDAEDRLAALIAPAGGRIESKPAGGGVSARARSTYPFDENAPQQRAV